MNIKNKKVLVTGADGFIGSHLTETLLYHGCEVRALSFYNSFNYWGWLEDIQNRNKLEIVTGDIRDSNFCRKITKDIDVVFNLAALIAIPYSYIAPDSYIDTNIKGTLNICQAAMDNSCDKIIHTSTSEVYGTARYVPIDEDHPKQPQSPYSATKIGADAIALSFYYTYGLPVAIARPFNTYGPRQSARAVIPTIITQILTGVKSIKLGDLRPTRDFNYVKDTCKGFICIANSDKAEGKEINIASNSEISISSTLELIKKLMRSEVKFIVEKQRLRPEKSEVLRLVGDNSCIKNLCGYDQEYTLKQGLEETIEWFSKPLNIEKYKSVIYNV